MKLKRKKIGDRSYLLVDSETGKLIAHAANTSSGGDDYPWSWHLADGVEYNTDEHPKIVGSSENLKGIVDYVETMINHYGLKGENYDH